MSLLDCKDLKKEMKSNQIEYRNRKVQEARVYAEQDLNKLRKEYEDRFNMESDKVRLKNLPLSSHTEKERERWVIQVRWSSSVGDCINKAGLRSEQETGH